MMSSSFRRSYAHKIPEDILSSNGFSDFIHWQHHGIQVKNEIQDENIDLGENKKTKMEHLLKTETPNLLRGKPESTERAMGEDEADTDVIILSDDDDDPVDLSTKFTSCSFRSSTPAKPVFICEARCHNAHACSIVTNISALSDSANEDTLPIFTIKDRKGNDDKLGINLERSGPPLKRARELENSEQGDDSLVHSSTSDTSQKSSCMVDSEVQVELPIAEYAIQIANLSKDIDDLNRSNAVYIHEIDELKKATVQKDHDHQRLLFEKEEELKALKQEIHNKENEFKRSLDEKSRESEKLREKLKQKDIALIAATSLLGLSMEDVVRKSVEAQMAKVALIQQTNLLAQTSSQLQVAALPAPSSSKDSSSNNNERNTETPRETSQPLASTGVPKGYCKGEYTRRDRRSTGGVYEDAFPLQPDVLKDLASGSNVAEFIRNLLLHCFTEDYLESKTISKMNEAQVDSITDATMANFKEYRTKKDTVPQSLNRPTVRTFISNTLRWYKEKAAQKKKTRVRSNS